MFKEKLIKVADSIYKEAKEYLVSQIMLHDGRMQYKYEFEIDEGVYYIYNSLIVDEDMDIVLTDENCGHIDRCLYDDELCEIASDIYYWNQKERERE